MNSSEYRRRKRSIENMEREYRVDRVLKTVHACAPAAPAPDELPLRQPPGPARPTVDRPDVRVEYAEGEILIRVAHIRAPATCPLGSADVDAVHDAFLQAGPIDDAAPDADGPSGTEIEKILFQCRALDSDGVAQGTKAIAIWLYRNWTADLAARFGEPSNPHTLRRWRAGRFGRLRRACVPSA